MLTALSHCPVRETVLTTEHYAEESIAESGGQVRL